MVCEWRKISDKPNYSISSNGDVRNDKTGRILKPYKNNSGYYQVMLGSKTSPVYIHRLVAKAFIPNPDDLPQVDHINGNKLDNRVDNLRWVTVSDNCYGFGYEQRIENRKKEIIAFNDLIGLWFSSRQEAADYFGCSKSQIKYDYLYKRGTKKGWMLKLVEDIV